LTYCYYPAVPCGLSAHSVGQTHPGRIISIFILQLFWRQGISASTTS
jgi:hypothetical protein